ncbi:MAG: PilZ domain-containing protein [Pseudomonadota bacterium]
MQVGQTIKERRKYLRFPCNLPVYDLINDNRLGNIIDIGLGGICIKTDLNLKPEKNYDLLIDAPEKSIQLRGKIANFRNDSNKHFFGLTFSNAQPVEIQKIRNFVSQQYKFKAPSFLATNATFPLINNTDGNPACLENSFNAGSQEFATHLEKIKLDPKLLSLISEYDKIGTRNHFLWKWGHAAIWLTTIDGVRSIADVCHTKLAALMLTTILDDLADKFQASEAITDAYLGCLHPNRYKSKKNNKWKNHLELALTAWEHIQQKIKTYPNYEALKDVLDFSYEQLFNSMRYACLANRVPSFANLTEYFLYQPPNMEVMIHGTIDLMDHPDFNINELAKARKAFWLAQDLARISNALVTWERELTEHDFSSAVFAYAMDHDIVSEQEWKSKKPEYIQNKVANSNYLKYFLDQWLTRYNFLCSFLKQVQLESVDLNSYVASMPRLLVDFHLNARGLI